MYDAHAHGSTYQSRDQKSEVQVKAIGFVDDVRTSINAFVNNTITLEQLATLATRDSQLWHDILTTSNQALELPKCGFHAIIFDFEPTGAPMMVDNPDCSITLRNPEGHMFNIDKWKTSKATKYLGAYKAPADQHKQTKILQRKCDDFCRIINCSHLTRSETQCFYWAIYRLSANYVLPTMYFTKAQLHKIQAHAHRAMVGRSGYCRTTANAIIYGQKRYGGAGFFHLYDDQGYGQIKLFMKLWRSPTTQAGKLLRVMMSWAQYCVGSGTPVLHDVTTKWPHFEAKWLTSLRTYLRDIGGRLQLQNHGVCKLQRMHDSFIMDIAVSSKKFGPTALKRINYCRMYLNVLLVSDISTPNGQRIDHAAYAGDRENLHSIELGHSVNQARPNEKAWADWKRCLHLVASRDEHHSLKEPLGAWIVAPTEYAREWPHYYSNITDRLYRHTALGYSVHHRIRHDFDKDTDVYIDTLPHDAIPVEARDKPHTWVLPRMISTQDIIQDEATPPSTISLLVEELRPCERSLLQETIFIRPEAEVWDALTQGQCFIASDGSAPKDRGSFAWIMSNYSGERLARCSGPVFGHAISSYRAESYGILSFLRFLCNMIRLHGTHGDKLKTPHLVCDNQGVVTTITKLLSYPSIYPNTTMAAEWDCMAQILETRQYLGPLFPTVEHVKGHQDENTPYEELPLLAQLNCNADAHANTFLRNHPTIAHTIVHQFPAGQCLLHLKQGTITRDLKQECAEAQTLPVLKAYIIKKAQ